MAKEFEKEEQTEKKQSIRQLDSKLNRLVGIENVKKDIKELKSYLTYINLTKEILKLEQPNLNMAFLGNPGTGKTTVARIIAGILHKLGYVEKNKFTEITTSDLVAEYVGQTAIKTKKILSENKGSVIFIDEAYSFNSQGQVYADEALVEIIKELDNHKTVFIFAGYKDEMQEFINMNPGLKSRIGYFIEFNDYSLNELMEIFMLKIKNSRLRINKKAKEEVKKLIATSMNNPKFGNGRFIDKLFDKILINHAVNVVDSNELNFLKTITENDITEELLEEIEPKAKQKKLGF